jgi:hypothetical protein
MSGGPGICEPIAGFGLVGGTEALAWLSGVELWMDVATFWRLIMDTK